MDIDFGNRFKQWRQTKGLTLKELADDTVSIASISRFERGEQDLGITMVASLLHKMNSSVQELVTYNASSSISDVSIYVRVGQLHIKHDVPALVQMFREHHAQYEQTKVTQTLSECAVIASAVADLSGKQLLTKKEINILFERVVDVEIWDSAALTEAGSLTILLSNQQIWLLFKDVLSELEQISRTDRVAYGDAWVLLLNSFEVMLTGDHAIAQKMYKLLAPTMPPFLAIDIQVRKYFLNQLFVMTDGGDSGVILNARVNAVKVIDLLSAVGNDEVAQQYLHIMDEVREQQ